MSIFTHIFGKKNAPGQAEALEQAHELFQKVEHAFPESNKVAMRLIEKRPPEVDTVCGHGGPASEAFTALVIKAINLKHQHVDPAARQLAPGDLPPLAQIMDHDAANLGQLAELARHSDCALICLKHAREWGEWNNVLLSIEAHREFAADPQTVLVYPCPDEFIVRREFLLEAAQALDPRLEIAQIPERLARHARKQPHLEEDHNILTAFGYPLTKFVAGGD